jgi:hypothetical protein
MLTESSRSFLARCLEVLAPRNVSLTRDPIPWNKTTYGFFSDWLPWTWEHDFQIFPVAIFYHSMTSTYELKRMRIPYLQFLSDCLVPELFAAQCAVGFSNSTGKSGSQVADRFIWECANPVSKTHEFNPPRAYGVHFRSLAFDS